jgi:hypothetical protein
MSEINNYSLTNIYFFNKDKTFSDLIKALQFYNIIFAGDGIFFVIRNRLNITITKLEDVEYSNINLHSLDFKSYSKKLVPSPPIKVLSEILEIFKYVLNKSKNEICINIYYDTIKKSFILDIMNQFITSTNVKYEYSNYEQDERYIRYLQIHSHHSMPANFSPGDNQDEKSKIPCYFGVLGKLSENSNLINMDYKFRFWNGLNFVPVKIEEIFDIEKMSVSINHRKSTLDNIIKLSSEELEKQKEEFKKQKEEFEKQRTVNFMSIDEKTIQLLCG